MDEKNYKAILKQMDIGYAIFRVTMDHDRMSGACIEDCNEHYLNVAEQGGLQRDQILHHSYWELSPRHDPRWDSYLYQAAVLRRHVHGGFRNLEFGTWMEITGGPAVEKMTCWMIFIDHTRFQDENEKLLKERHIDQLTYVNNRNAYEDSLKELEGESGPVGVIMTDINGLKEVNDSCGHEKGDLVIETTAAFLCGFTPAELPYRVGGDEFVLLLKGCTREEVDSSVQKIRAFSEVSLSCGGGWAENGSCIHDAAEEADAAMYEDKKIYYRSHERRHVH